MSSAKNALCALAMMPIREEPKHRAQMVSMLLFGELFEIVESQEYWHKMVADYDKYEGWIYCRKPLFVEDDFLEKFKSEIPVYSTSMVYHEHEMSLTFGSRLPLFKDGEFLTGELKHFYSDAYMQKPGNASAKEILNIAENYLGTPYLWGGRNLLGIDCSGFTQMCFKLNGISLPRDAYQQAEIGEKVNSLEEVKPGDLAFFSENNRVTHVGILTGDGHIIHASEWVRKDSIDSNGIFNNDLQSYTLKPTSIKRYI